MTPLAPVIATDPLHLEGLIEQAIAANGLECDLNHIDVSKIERFNLLFTNFPKFNGDISKWDTSSATEMNGTFFKSWFKGDISQWNTSKVTTMENMFKNSKFNGDVSKWEVHNAQDLSIMFYGGVFAQDISNWRINGQANTRDFFENNPHFLAAQSMTPWVVVLYIEAGVTPTAPEWSLAFTDVHPVATALGFELREHVRAVLDAHRRIVGSLGPGNGLGEPVDPNVFEASHT